MRGDPIDLYSFPRRESGEAGADLFSLVSSDGTHGDGSRLCQGGLDCIRKHFFRESAMTPLKRFPREVVSAPSLCLQSGFAGMRAVIQLPLC